MASYRESRRWKHAWQRIAAALPFDQYGASFVQMLTLVVCLALGTTGAVKALSDRIREKTVCAGEAIVSLTPGVGRCGQPSIVALAGGPQGDGAEGPALDDAGPLVVLPFPGSVSISCTGLKDQRATCKDQPGVHVQATGELSVDRSKTRLDDQGCPRQDLSVSTKLQLELSARARTAHVGGALSVFTGAATRFKATVSPDAASAIAHGDRPPPNPVDPTTIAPGESVQLSEEFFAGLKMQATYRAMQVDMGFDGGRRLSSGVKRISPRTVRVLVGDADFVRQSLSLGVTAGSVGISIGGKEELSSGVVRAVDIDIATPEGWDAYQQFLATGRLPEDSAPGTTNPTTTESIDSSAASRLEARLGRFKLGTVLSDSEGHVIETHNADGSVDTVGSVRFNNIGAAVRESVSAGGTTERHYSLLLEGARGSTIETYEQSSGQSLAASEDGNVRIDFTAHDLFVIRAQAFDQLVKTVEESQFDLSRDDISRLVREDPERLREMGLNTTVDHAFELATARSPEDVLVGLYQFGGHDGSGNTALQGLSDFMDATTAVRHDRDDFPRDHADSLLPGTPLAPDCE
jgi:hypothetical protein